jgi:hypothetical protein
MKTPRNLAIKTESASQEHHAPPEEVQMKKGHPVIMVEVRASMVQGPTIKIVGIIVVLLMVTIAMKDAISNKGPIGHKTIIVKAIMALTDQIVNIKIDIAVALKVAQVAIAKITDPEGNMVIAHNTVVKVDMNHEAILIIVAVVVMTIAVLMISVPIIGHVVNMEIAHSTAVKAAGAMKIMNADLANSMIEEVMANREPCAHVISEIIAINRIIAAAAVVTIIVIP